MNSTSQLLSADGLWVSGPKDRETARAVMTTAIKDGIGFDTFAKRRRDGYPVEVLISTDYELRDPPPDDK
jgi:hypothetical protein